jgi:hypothetical protein
MLTLPVQRDKSYSSITEVVCSRWDGGYVAAGLVCVIENEGETSIQSLGKQMTDAYWRHLYTLCARECHPYPSRDSYDSWSV